MSQLILESITDYKPSYRAHIVQSLAEFRREWQQTIKGKNLVDAQASVGLLLSDIAERLELNEQERHVMLGGKLTNQVNSILEEQIKLKLPA